MSEPSTVAVSIMAGRTLGFLEGALPGAALIRAMPNTPAAIGRGITVAAPNPRVTASQRELVHTLLSAIGAVEWMSDEGLMDAVTAVSGSGPAYIFLLAECMARAGVAAGLPADLSENARARDGVGLGRVAQPLAAAGRDLARERHLAGRHHRGRARRADGPGRARSADDQGDRRRHPARTRTGGVKLALAALPHPRRARRRLSIMLIARRADRIAPSCQAPIWLRCSPAK